MNGVDRNFNVLINAYAISPNWGSEQGMGWNWVTNLAKYCHLDVITEGEWRDLIEDALNDLPQKDNLTFHYLPVSDNVRRMCWNQGDWRFYWHYESWQRRALDKAREICANKHIDILHQLNMIGFREPGYLWKIDGIPFIWGPIGGMELMPMAYLQGAPLKQRLFNRLKNCINKYQYTHSARVKSAIERSSALISAVKGVKDVISDIHHRESVLINETGVEINSSLKKRVSTQGQPLRIIWVGKFDFRKQLPIALRSIIALNRRDVEFHICGSGSEETIAEMKRIAEEGGISAQCHWHGNVINSEVKCMMADSDLMFFTSIMEATSTVVLEAISVGLPVLCFNTCGFGPIVKDFAGITIELSDPNKSVQDFAIELRKVYENRNLLNEISSNIIAQRESLTWDSKAKKTIRLYHNCINGQVLNA
ncbi:MAG: glycosyltransferase family 4 protein [Muribaculaceae bacterium]|nr:glycosyltransferase family 4 protein [Muribaculaceae bacterium]